MSRWVGGVRGSDKSGVIVATEVNFVEAKETTL